MSRAYNAEYHQKEADSSDFVGIIIGFYCGFKTI